MSVSTELLNQVAHELMDAESKHAPIPPITGRYPGFNVDDAYQVQSHVLEHRLSGGKKVVGRKVGLTSKAMQEMLGVDQPDYGVLLEDMLIEDGAEFPAAELLQPRIEAEIGFMLKADLTGPDVTAEQVLEATDYLFAALEVIDSRIKDWRIKLQDTIADNASSARVVVGAGRVSPAGLDLAREELVFECNGQEVGRATGEAVLGHPANAVAWLASTLHRRGVTIAAGQLIIPGALTAAIPVIPGDTVKATFTNLGTVSVRFT